MNNDAGYQDMLAVGLTPRRADVWTRRGYLQPVDPAPGSGVPRRWPATEPKVAAMMLRLVAAGLTAEAAHRVARAGGAVDLADGVHVTVA